MCNSAGIQSACHSQGKSLKYFCSFPNWSNLEIIAIWKLKLVIVNREKAVLFIFTLICLVLKFPCLSSLVFLNGDRCVKRLREHFNLP